MNSHIQKVFICPINLITPKIWKNRQKYFPIGLDCKYENLAQRTVSYISGLRIPNIDTIRLSEYVFLWLGNFRHNKRKLPPLPVHQDYDIIDLDDLITYIKDSFSL